MAQSKEEGYKCEQCGMTFPSQEELEEHMRQHERAAEIFRCEKCKMTFDSQEELERHVREIHGK